MKVRAQAFLLSGALIACQQQTPGTQPTEMRTIENAQVSALPAEPQATLEPELPSPMVKPGQPPPATPAKSAEETLAERMDLPFAPAIAMDPVDGAKVSITRSTPMTEYKNKIYYFTSEANRRQFMAAPETYTKGQLAKY